MKSASDGGVLQRGLQVLHMGDAGDMLFTCRVAFNEAIGGCQFPKFLADTFIGERRTNKVNLRLTQPQVDCQPRLMLTVSWYRYKLRRKLRAVFPERFLINFQLFFQGAPSAHRGNKPPLVQLLHNKRECVNCFPFQQDIWIVLMNRSCAPLRNTLPSILRTDSRGRKNQWQTSNTSSWAAAQRRRAHPALLTGRAGPRPRLGALPLWAAVRA